MNLPPPRLKIWNTLTGQKEDFTVSDGQVRMYVCGITPYSEAHVGHAMSAIVFDMVRRYLEFRGFQVKHVQNFTDVDDKLIARAQQVGGTVADLAEHYIQQFFEDAAALNVRRAHVHPRVSEEIPSIIDVIRVLVEKDFAYESRGDVYYRVSRFAGYGKLSHRSLESMIAGARVEVDEQKDSPADFALWKAAKPGEPQWDSPWGPGRPGWHIECSAMAMRHLGSSLDIHGGGQDLIFPHHENEIAQSEAASGVEPFARYWMHNGLLRLGEEKMSKSLGNLVTIREALAAHSADAIRLFVLTSHYRSPLTYSEEALDAAEKGVDRLREALRPGTGSSGAVDPAPHYTKFVEAMDDDFGSASAIASLFDLAREINRGREAGADVAPAQAALRELAGVLGLTLAEREDARSAEAGPFIELLIKVRAELRSQRNFALADSIRKELGESGVALEDSPSGTTWKWSR